MIEMPGSTFTSESISGFDPRSVAGCQLWLDASDTSSLTGSSPVTAWRNKGLSGNNATYSGSPSISATAINGRQAMYFNGSSYFTGAISGANTTTITVFIVGSLISPFVGFSGLLCFGNASQLDYDNVGSLPITMYNADFKIYGARNSSSQPTPISANVPFLYVLQYDGTYINTWLNGTQQTDPSINIASSGTFTYTNYSVACRAGTITGQYIWSGYFGEILVYQSALTTTERQQVEGYLASKWGLQTTPILPTSIPALTMWLDGADPSTLFTDTSATTAVTADGNSIAAWRDKSTNAYLFTQATAGSRPTYKTSILNGRSITRWNGTSTFLQSSATLPFYTSSTSGGSFFVVFMATTVTSQRFLMTYQNEVTNTYCGTESELGYTTGNNGQGNFGMHQGCSRATIAASGTIVINSYVLMSYILATTGTTPANSTIFKNGNSLTPSNDQTGFYSAGSYPSANNARFLNIGARVFNGSQATDCWHSGDIAELIWYRTPLTTPERQSIEAYLARKWNISVPTQVLSTTHPFSSIRPFSRYFNPIDIQSCQLWLDAADSSATGGGSTLTTWLDKSGNGNTATSGSGTIAVSSTGLTFNGSTNYMTVAGLAGAIANTSFVIFIVETLTGSSGYFFGDDNVNAGTDSALHIGYRSQTNQTFAFYSDDLEDYSVSGSNIRRVWTLWLPTGANRVTRRNGAVDVTLGNSNRLLSFTAPRIGRVFGGNYYPGIISEILVYTTDIGLQNVLPIEGYLAWKWGLQASLPAMHPYKQFPPSSALPFLPTNILGCVLWLDAADSSTITRSGVNMTQWNDKSGLSNNMLPYSTFSNVTVMSNYWNGLNVLNFSGGGVYQAPASSAVYPIDLYVVLAVKDLTTNVDVISLTPSAAVDNFNSLTFSEYTSRRWHNGSTGFSRTPNTVSPTDETSTSFLLMNWSIANNNFVLRRNGTQLSQTASYTWTMTAGSVFQLGYRISPLVFSPATTSGPFRGYIGEIVAFNSQLSSSQRQQVEGYLASKWALQNSLPITHPYRTFQPAQTSFVIITPGTIATVTLSALSGSGGTITWTTSTNAVSYKWYVGTTYPTALTSGTVGAVLTTSVSYAFIASTNYYAWVIPVSSTGTDGATTQSAAASYSTGGGITVSSSGTAADMTAAANTISGSFAGVDDSFGQLPCISFGINGTSGYTTAYVGTNGYITFASGQGNIPSANNPGVPSIPAIKIRGYDSRGISCTYASGSKPSNANITYTRIVGNWYPYYGVNAGLIPLEIFLVRDATATKQYIWIKIGSSYNNNGYGDSDWAVTNGSSYLVNVAYPGAGTSIVFESSGFTGASWTATSPGSLVGLLT
jgi:hypothetical protein